MLYSPLYYSIRLVLVGAIGLPVSLLCTAQSHAQAPQSQSPQHPINSDVAAVDQPNDTIVADMVNDSLLEETDIPTDPLPEPLPAVVASEQSTVATAVTQQPPNSANFDSIDNIDSVDHTNSTDGLDNQDRANENLLTTTNSPSSTTENKARTADKGSNSTALQQALNTDAANRSLERLTEFYQRKPTTTKVDQSATQISPANHDKSDRNSATLATNIAPVVAPSIYYGLRQSTPARCSGTWVSPILPSDYQRALQQQQQQQANINPNSPISATNTQQTSNTLPIFAQADYAYYDSLSYLELSGDVEVVQAGQFIQSDQLVIDVNQGVGGAKGNILFTDAASSKTAATMPNTNTAARSDSQPLPTGSGLIGVADELAYNANGQATAQGVAFASIPMQAHGYAKRLNKPNDTTIELDKVMFSTCPPDDRKWQLEAQQIDLDTATGRGEAYDTTFRLGNVPVFYLPYFNFPIDSRRTSGFLLPRTSIDTQSGVQVSVPYYFNLAPNYDATLTTQLFTNRNPMLTGEMRYLTKNFGTGQFIASYLPNDKQYRDEDRKGVFYSHNWTSENIPHLSASGIYNYVSDPNYLNDFDNLGLSDNAINLPRRIEANYYNDYLTGQLKVETFQSLDAVDAEGKTVLDKDKPYSRLPQISINYRLPWFQNLNITGVHDSAYFKKSINDGSENEKSGVRLYNQLSASYPLQRSWGYITPKVSLQHLYTSYDETSRLDNNLSKDDKSQSVFVPQYSIDAGLNFYQAGSPMHWFDDTLGGYQLLSPRLKYVYAPYQDQNDVPNFNTRIASLNYSQLFADSWFLGHDRLPDNNALTPGVNYRYIDAMGVTRFDASIGKQFYLKNGRVTLSENDTIFTDSNSGVVWSSSAQPYQNLWLDFDGALKANASLNFVTTQLRYRPTADSLFNAGYIHRLADSNTNQQPLSALTASTILPIKNNWRVLAQGQYDIRNNKMIDALVGVDYQDCCYGFAIYGRNYYNDLNLDSDPTRAIMAEFRINGFGSSSNDSRLNRLLADKISGFEPVDSYWKQ